MWSPERRPQRRALLALLLVAPLLSGCLRPLYAPDATGASVATTLKSVEVAPIPDRIGHFLRDELVFALDGSGLNEVPKRYRLEITTKQTLSAPVFDTSVGRADAGSILVEAFYKLKPAGSDTVRLEGRAFTTVTYDRSQQRFANVRAARDAEIRATRVLADQIRTRLAAGLAGA